MSDVDPVADVRSLLESGRIIEAATMLSRAAKAGDGHALYELAMWSVAGNIIERDLPQAYTLLERAKSSGHKEAALLYAYFTAAGTGCTPQWTTARSHIEEMAKNGDVAQRQLELLNQMDLDADGNPAEPFNLALVSHRPKTAVCRPLLTAAECDYVMDVGAPYLAPSDVVDPQTGNLIPHPVRKSHGAMFGVYIEDMVIAAINRRISAVSGTKYEQGEPLQLLQYQRGDEYRPHLDALPGEQNQRVLTVIVYRSDNYEGGETEFSRTGFSFRGQKGDALLFANVMANGQHDPLSLHCGRPVTSGTKWIASRWIRHTRFAYRPPKPILENFPAFVD